MTPEGEVAAAAVREANRLQNEAVKAKKDGERIRKLARARRKAEDPDATESSDEEGAGDDPTPFEDEDFFDALYTPAPPPSGGVGPSGTSTATSPPRRKVPFDAAVSGSGSSGSARSPRPAPSETAPPCAPPAGAAAEMAPGAAAGQGLVRIVSAPCTAK